MIVYRAGESATVRRGEFEPLPGLRGRFRAVPYPGFEREGADPWSRTYRARRADQEPTPGSRRPEVWRDALAAIKVGPLLVGPAPAADAIYGVVPAVVAAARRLGLGTILLDASEGARAIAPGEDLVIVHPWRAGDESDLGSRCSATAAIGVTGVALPVIPGWTDEPDCLAKLFSDLRASGATFVVPFTLDLAGPGRAALLEDSEAMGPAGSELFDRLFHGGFDERVIAARARVVEAARASGLAIGVPMPRGAGEHASNLSARQALERAAAESADPSASELRRAARRIEEYRGDLGALFREGNGRLVVEPGSPAWPLVVLALDSAP
jgi:hypothetical protein